MVGGTAPAVTVQTNSGMTLLFHRFCRRRPMAELVRCFQDPFVVVSSPSRLFRFSSLAFTPSRTLTRHVPRSTVAVSHDVVLMMSLTYRLCVNYGDGNEKRVAETV